jgi:hypothetical protein
VSGTQKLPKDVEANILKLCATGREAAKRRDLEAAERAFVDAWALIPDPKAEWDFYPQSLSRGLVEHFMSMGQHDKAKAWLITTRAMYGSSPASDASLAMLAGRVCFEAGELDEAKRIFADLHRQHGRRPFAMADPKYLRLVIAK